MEIMNEDGTMARMPELQKMAKEWNMRIITIKDLIAYRLKNESIIEVAKRWTCLQNTDISSLYRSASRATDWSTWH